MSIAFILPKRLRWARERSHADIELVGSKTSCKDRKSSGIGSWPPAPDFQTDSEAGKMLIPNVCRTFGVDYVDTVELIRRTGARCVLQ